MKYYSYDLGWFSHEPAKIRVMSEIEILDNYWDTWKERMIKKWGEKRFQKFSEFDCIDDWIVENWAKPSNREEYENQKV